MIASRDFDNYEKKKQQEWRKEHTAGGFRCSHCKQWVVINDYMGTVNRNHCNICLWSKHVDEEKGDRRAKCHGGMRPIGLTYKHAGWGKQGEVMLVHECASCMKLSINRIAADDFESIILDVFECSLTSKTTIERRLRQAKIRILNATDRDELQTQLFGTLD